MVGSVISSMSLTMEGSASNITVVENVNKGKKKPHSSPDASASQQDASTSQQDASTSQQDASASQQDASASQQDASASQQDASASQQDASTSQQQKQRAIIEIPHDEKKRDKPPLQEHQGNSMYQLFIP